MFNIIKRDTSKIYSDRVQFIPGKFASISVYVRRRSILGIPLPTTYIALLSVKEGTARRDYTGAQAKLHAIEKAVFWGDFYRKLEEI